MNPPQTGTCPYCKHTPINKRMIVCPMCGSRLPWADDRALDAQPAKFTSTQPWWAQKPSPKMLRIARIFTAVVWFFIFLAWISYNNNRTTVDTYPVASSPTYTLIATPYPTPTPYVYSAPDAYNSAPAQTGGTCTTGATAVCSDGSTSYAAHHQGACSHHGGVAQWCD